MRAIIFDFDGTIVDTEWPEVLAWMQIFNTHGVEYPVDAWKATIGRGADQEAQRPANILATALGDPGLASQLNQEHRQVRIQIIERQPVLPGVVELITAAESEGIRLAIASSSDRPWVQGHLNRIGLSPHFEFLCCQEDVKETKPNPALYLLALAKLGMANEEVVALEDSPHGVTAAKTAGIYTVAIPNRLTAQLNLSHADWIVSDLTEVSIPELRSRLV